MGMLYEVILGLLLQLLRQSGMRPCYGCHASQERKRVCSSYSSSSLLPAFQLTLCYRGFSKQCGQCEQDQPYMCSIVQSCLILCDPTDCSLPGSSLHGISQARRLEWLAAFFSRSTICVCLLVLCMYVNICILYTYILYSHTYIYAPMYMREGKKNKLILPKYRNVILKLAKKSQILDN